MHMLVTNHVLSGAVIGAATRRILPAFLLGIASHFALDAVPHWGDRSMTLMQVAVPDGLAGLAVMGAMTAVAPRGSRAAVLAGMAGAALPDLNKPAVVFFGRSPFPRAVDRLHKSDTERGAAPLQVRAGRGRGVRRCRGRAAARAQRCAAGSGIGSRRWSATLCDVEHPRLYARYGISERETETAPVRV